MKTHTSTNYIACYAWSNIIVLMLLVLYRLKFEFEKKTQQQTNKKTPITTKKHVSRAPAYPCLGEDQCGKHWLYRIFFKKTLTHTLSFLPQSSINGFTNDIIVWYSLLHVCQVWHFIRCNHSVYTSLKLRNTDDDQSMLLLTHVHPWRCERVMCTLKTGLDY